MMKKSVFDASFQDISAIAAQAGHEAVKRSRDAGHSQVYSRDNVLYFENRNGLKEVIGFIGEARTVDDLKESLDKKPKTNQLLK